jgi:signal transduction histidine kinase
MFLPRRARTLRTYLLVVALGSLLPMALFAAIVAARLGGAVQEETERRLLSSSVSMAAAFDREIAATIRTLRVLGRSENLEQADMEAFAAEAVRAMETQASWLTLLLLSPDGQILVQPGVPRGTPLGRVNEPESLAKAVASKQPVVGTLKFGQRKMHWAFPVRVPLIRDGQVRYILTAVLSAEALTSVVNPAGAAPQPEFTRTVVDPSGTVAMRSRNAARFVGSMATPSFITHTGQSREGIYQDRTLEGVEAYVAFSHSEEWGWTMAVIESRATVEAPLRRYVLLTGSMGLVALCLSLGLALVLANRLRVGIARASSAAEALARGEQRQAPAVGIDEVDELNGLLEQSGRLLEEREAERDLHRTGLERAVRARDEFLSVASHELKTPLTSLVLEAHRIELRSRKGGASGSEGLAPLLESFRKHARRLARLVDDMLDISRIHAGKLVLQRSRTDLGEVARGVVERVWPHVSGPRASMTFEAAPSVVGQWDADRLEQALTNLLTNAARYGEGKPVRVSVRREGSDAVVEVADEGQGIAPEDQQRVFGKFERAVNRNEVSGLGLGLFIVQNIVELHGGSVEVKSNVGQGSVFTIRLPGLEVRQPVELGSAEA